MPVDPERLRYMVREEIVDYGAKTARERLDALFEEAVAETTCLWCGKPLGPGRPQRRWDTLACRQKAYRLGKKTGLTPEEAARSRGKTGA